MAYGIEALNLYFQKRSDVYVSANSFIYYHIKKGTTGSISFWQKAFFLQCEFLNIWHYKSKTEIFPLFRNFKAVNLSRLEMRTYNNLSIFAE
jgi:hypothetical protein